MYLKDKNDKGEITKICIPHEITVHYLKLSDKFFLSALNHDKMFEIRKNDRGFRVGHYLRLDEYSEGFTGRRPIFRRIVYTSCHHQDPNYLVLGLKSVTMDDANFVNLLRVYPDLLKPIEPEVLKYKGNNHGNK